MRLFSLLAGLIAALALTTPLSAAEKAKPKDVDIVLCLDVSNSMDGLIDSAKLRLWDVVNALAKVKPTPNLRVGLYSYGCNDYPRSNGWVRKDLDLTTDLDEVYAKLNALKTNGGEEYVTRVTQTAVLDQKWSRDPHALKLIFVCGNEPADQDPEVKMAQAAETATKNGVIINTIYCGNPDNAEAKGWRDYARLCGGKYASIDQDKARHVAMATPFDKELGDLSTKLNTTYVPVGEAGRKGAANQAEQDANAAKAAPAAGAGRAVSKAEGLYKNSTWDLIDKMKDDAKFDLKTVKDEDLPEAMRKLTHEERLEYLKKKTAERAEIQKKIGEISTQRQKHIDDEKAKTPKTAGEKALDEALKEIIRTQAADKGIVVP